MPMEIGRSVGMLGNGASIPIGGNLSRIFRTYFRMGQALYVVANGEYQLIGYEPFGHKVKRHGVGHFLHYDPCFRPIISMLQHLAAAERLRLGRSEEHTSEL